MDLEHVRKEQTKVLLLLLGMLLTCKAAKYFENSKRENVFNANRKKPHNPHMLVYNGDEYLNLDDPEIGAPKTEPTTGTGDTISGSTVALLTGLAIPALGAAATRTIYPLFYGPQNAPVAVPQPVNYVNVGAEENDDYILTRPQVVPQVVPPVVQLRGIPQQQGEYVFVTRFQNAVISEPEPGIPGAEEMLREATRRHNEQAKLNAENIIRKALEENKAAAEENLRKVNEAREAAEIEEETIRKISEAEEDLKKFNEEQEKTFRQMEENEKEMKILEERANLGPISPKYISINPVEGLGIKEGIEVVQNFNQRNFRELEQAQIEQPQIEQAPPAPKPVKGSPPRRRRPPNFDDKPKPLGSGRSSNFRVETPGTEYEFDSPPIPVPSPKKSPPRVSFLSEHSAFESRRTIGLDAEALRLVPSTEMKNYNFLGFKIAEIADLQVSINRSISKFMEIKKNYPKKPLLPPPQTEQEIIAQLGSSIKESELITNNTFEAFLLDNIRRELQQTPNLIKLNTEEPAQFLNEAGIALKKLDRKGDKHYNAARIKLLNAISVSYNRAATSLYTLIRQRIPPADFLKRLNIIKNKLARDLKDCVALFITDLYAYENFSRGKLKTILAKLRTDLEGEDYNALGGGLILEFRVLFARLGENIDELTKLSYQLSKPEAVKDFYNKLYLRTNNALNQYIIDVANIRITTSKGNVHKFEPKVKNFSADWFLALSTFLKSDTDTSKVKEYENLYNEIGETVKINIALYVITDNKDNKYDKLFADVARFNQLQVKLLAYTYYDEEDDKGEDIPIELTVNEQMELTNLLANPHISRFNNLISTSKVNPLIEIFNPLKN